VENLGDTAYNAVYIGIKNKQIAQAGSTEASPAMDEQAAKILADYLVASLRR
jgi:hypothetical protein